MYYIFSLIIIIISLFIWQIPTDRRENVEYNALSKPVAVIVDNAEVKKPEVKPTTEKEVVEKKLVDQVVPFTSQAPFGGWEDERQQDGCEEASALMAVYWARGDSLNKLTAWNKITDISDFEQRSYGEYRDISLNDVVDHVFKDYFNYEKVAVKNNTTINDIIAELNKGNLVLAPMDGQKLNNPYFTAPGPERHMLVIRGYDPFLKEFITNDPGTKRGEAYRYDEDVLFNAIRPYPTGYHETISKMEKNIIIVSK